LTKKKWYVMEPDSIHDASIKWKPVDEVKYVRFTEAIVAACVLDHTDDRMIYCVHPARVKCVEVRDE